MSLRVSVSVFRAAKRVFHCDIPSEKQPCPCQINNPGAHPTARANERQCEFVCILGVAHTHTCTQTETEREEAERRSIFWRDDAQQQGAAEIVRAQNHHLAVSGKLCFFFPQTHTQQHTNSDMIHTQRRCSISVTTGRSVLTQRHLCKSVQSNCSIFGPVCTSALPRKGVEEGNLKSVQKKKKKKKKRKATAFFGQMHRARNS